MKRVIKLILLILIPVTLIFGSNEGLLPDYLSTTITGETKIDKPVGIKLQLKRKKKGQKVKEDKKDKNKKNSNIEKQK